MKKIVSIFEGPVSNVSVALAGLSIIIMMVIEFLNAIGRKVYMPFPCCLESAESLMITTVFLGIGYVALKEEHTQVTIVTRRMRPSTKRYFDAVAYLFGGITFAVLAWGAWPIAWNAMINMEIRIGVYRFPIWVFRIFFALGVTMMALQCFSNTIRFFSQAKDPNWKSEE